MAELQEAVKVAIANTQETGLLQTRWLEAHIHNGPGEPSLETGAWHRSFDKYGAEFGRFLSAHASPMFLDALRKELG